LVYLIIFFINPNISPLISLFAVPKAIKDTLFYAVSYVIKIIALTDSLQQPRAIKTYLSKD